MLTKFIVKKENKLSQSDNTGRIVYVSDKINDAIKYATMISEKTSENFDIYVLEQIYKDEYQFRVKNILESNIRWVSFFSIRKKKEFLNPDEIKVDIFDRYSA